MRRSALIVSSRKAGSKMMFRPANWAMARKTDRLEAALNVSESGSLAPAGNFGEGDCAIFEAVHGTAPDIAGQGIANPSALMLSAAMLLDHVGQAEPATRLRAGVAAALASDETRTRDLGGRADTQGFTDAVIGAFA